MLNKVFSITGNKISTFITDEESLKFSSSTHNTVAEFKEAFAKKLSLATKFEIKYSSIKSIKKEDNDKDILIFYKTSIGIPTNCEFSFSDPDDYEIFFNFLEKEKYFSKQHETLTPIKANTNYLIGLLATIAFTIFAYYQAVEITNGTIEETHSRKTKLFYNVIKLLGDKGVIVVGTLIAAYLVYNIWQRFSNPPNQTKFLPPSS
jgi:hypothetical protein